MRPIKLSITAFGPFIATESVDFEVFGERPLFLINGATGAGKTTILDAICFALYGQTTGKEREAMQMRCDYADDDTTTSVEFTFELAGTRYRILRIPEQIRSKKSGDGTTLQKARAELWQLGDDWDTETVLVPQKVTEATQKIEELTGLQVDQFRQVMVLPQGQFRRLLMADSKDREHIFSQLFETGIYKKIEDQLKQRASKVEAKVKGIINEQSGVLQSVSFEDAEALSQAIIEKEPEHKASALLKKTKDAEYLVAYKVLDAGKALDENFAHLARLNAQLKALQQQGDANEAKEKQLNLFEQAVKVKPTHTEFVRSELDLKTRSQETEDAKKVLSQANVTLKETTLEIEESKGVEQQKDVFKQRIESLKSYRERSSKVQVAENELKQTDSAHQKNVISLESETKQIDQLNAQIKQNEVEKNRLELLLTREAEVAAQAEKLSQVVDAKKRYELLVLDKEKLEKQIAAITETGKQTAAQTKRIEKESKQIDLAWHTGQAAILAKQLEKDQPCLVCGSLEHPSPAQASIELPTNAQRELAQQALEAARSELEKAREAFTNLKSSLDKGLAPQIAELVTQLGAYAVQSSAQLKQQHETVATELLQMQSNRKLLASVDKQLDAFKTRVESAKSHLEQTQKQFNDSLLQLQSRKAELEVAQKELPNEYRQSGKLEEDIAATEASLAKLIQQIETVQLAHANAEKKHSNAEMGLQNLTKRLKALQLNAETYSKQWQLALEESVFSTTEAFLKADLTPEAQDRLKSEVDDFKTKLQTLSGATQEREKSLDGKQQPDLIALQLALDNALVEKNQADQDAQQIDKHLNRLQEAQKSHLNLAAKQKAYEDEYKVIGTLSNVANGQTGNKISLQRFVLGVLLDDVLLAASSRLTRMSKGRYNLIRKEDRAKGNKASGLEMEVEDTYTGKVRAVSTLSGGESFLASLSLALGLSDVVQAYAGGIRLETLFIDEGFGSLDTDTLDLAIKTLIDLRNTGRIVGIISHVPELKEQIAMRLDVVSGRQGSRIELVY